MAQVGLRSLDRRFCASLKMSHRIAPFQSLQFCIIRYARPCSGLMKSWRRAAFVWWAIWLHFKPLGQRMRSSCSLLNEANSLSASPRKVIKK